MSDHRAVLAMNTVDKLMRGCLKYSYGWKYTGAIRRGEDFVDVVELIMMPKTGKISEIGNHLFKHCYKVNISHRMVWDMEFLKLPVRIYISNRENFEAMQLIKTGPEAFVRDFIQAAEAKGYRLSEAGFYQGTTIIIPEFESIIFEKVGIQYLKPQERGPIDVKKESDPQKDQSIISKIGALL